MDANDTFVQALLATKVRLFRNEIIIEEVAYFLQLFNNFNRGVKDRESLRPKFRREYIDLIHNSKHEIINTLYLLFTDTV